MTPPQAAIFARLGDVNPLQTDEHLLAYRLRGYEMIFAAGKRHCYTGDEAHRLMRTDTNKGRLANGTFGLIAHAARLLGGLPAAKARKAA